MLLHEVGICKQIMRSARHPAESHVYTHDSRDAYRGYSSRGCVVPETPEAQSMSATRGDQGRRRAHPTRDMHGGQRNQHEHTFKHVTPDFRILRCKILHLEILNYSDP
jgi:hypothetical protein